MALVKSRWKLRPGEKFDRIGRIVCPHGERRMYCEICITDRRNQWKQKNPDSVLQSSLNQLDIGVTAEW